MTGFLSAATPPYDMKIIAFVPSENAMGSANDDRNRNTLYFGEMIVYFEFLFEIARLGCLVVSLYDDLVALFRSDGVLVASRISSFAEDCDDTVLVVIFEILENSFQCCIGRS